MCSQPRALAYIKTHSALDGALLHRTCCLACTTGSSYIITSAGYDNENIAYPAYSRCFWQIVGDATCGTLQFATRDHDS